MTQASVKQRKSRKAFREQQNTESASDLGQGADHIQCTYIYCCWNPMFSRNQTWRVSLLPSPIEAGDLYTDFMKLNTYIALWKRNNWSDFGIIFFLSDSVKLWKFASLSVNSLDNAQQKHKLQRFNAMPKMRIAKPWTRYALSKCLLFSDVLKIIILRKRRNSLSWHRLVQWWSKSSNGTRLCYCQCKVNECWLQM